MIIGNIIGLCCGLIGFIMWTIGYSIGENMSVLVLVLCFIGSVGNSYFLASEISRKVGSKNEY